MKVKAKFSIGTHYIKSEWSQEIEFDFEDDATDQDIDNVLTEEYQQWVNDHNTGGFHIIEKIKES